MHTAYDSLNWGGAVRYRRKSWKRVFDLWATSPRGLCAYFICVVALAVQCLALQRHVQQTSISQSGLVAAALGVESATISPGQSTSGGEEPGNTGPDKDETICLLYLATLSIDHFVLAGSTALRLSTLSSVLITAAETTNIVGQASHAWRGRAPPLA